MTATEQALSMIYLAVGELDAYKFDNKAVFHRVLRRLRVRRNASSISVIGRI